MRRGNVRRLLRLEFYRAIERLANDGDGAKVRRFLDLAEPMLEDLEAIDAAERLILQAAAAGDENGR